MDKQRLETGKPEYLQFAEEIAGKTLECFNGDEQNEICKIIRDLIIKNRIERIESNISVAKTLEDLNSKI